VEGGRLKGGALDVGLDVPLELIETRTFGSGVIYERYGRRDRSSDPSEQAVSSRLREPKEE
jgi:hypothetical protein